MTAGSDAARPRRSGVLSTATLLLLAGCGDTPTAQDPVCRGAQPILAGETAGETLDGALTTRDALFRGAHIDYYALELADPATIRVELASAELDPLLFLFDERGAIRAQAFDSLGAPPGEPETAALSAPLEPGCHLLGASSWVDRATGRYTLHAEVMTD